MSEENTTTPPWGEEESNFDAARAWQLIQNLRTEKGDLKAQLDERDATIGSLTQENNDKATSIQEFESKLAERDSALAEKDGAIAKSEAVITKHQLLSAAGLDLDYADQVVGDDETAWKSSVGKLQKLAGTSSAQRAPDPVQVAAGGEPPADKDAEARKIFGI